MRECGERSDRVKRDERLGYESKAVDEVIGVARWSWVKGVE